MARRRYRRRHVRRRGIPVYPFVIAFFAIAGFVWWLIPDVRDPGPEILTLASRPALKSDRPEFVPEDEPTPGVSEKGANESTDPAPAPVETTLGNDVKPATAERTPDRPKAGNQPNTGTANNASAQRKQLTEALHAARTPADRQRIRGELSRLGRQLIFSASIDPDDPLVDRYTIQSGDSLAKIARRYKIAPGLLAEINNIANPNLIRAGQALKVINGPFHARVYKHDYTMDVYLQDECVATFRVGLGADNGTPTGTWQVGTKLKNPTYYPPRGGKIVAADDPTNPLGERWIALKGISGEAVGAQRYGIHGTIEPDSIGKSESLGCVRMHNEDVAVLYTLLVEGDSQVEILD